MDFAEISTVFSDNPQQQDTIQETTQHIVTDEPRKLTCSDYDLHAQYCTACMYRQAKRRSNVFNIFLILALFYIVLRK